MSATAFSTTTATPRQSSFSNWLAALLRHLQFPATTPLSSVATFHFGDKPPVYVTGRSGQIDMMSEAGRLAVPYAAETLLSLLALNRCHGSYDAACVTLDRASGTVIVWARQRQVALDAVAGARLLEIVRHRVEAVQALLGPAGRPAPGRATGASTLARMLRQQQPVLDRMPGKDHA